MPDKKQKPNMTKEEQKQLIKEVMQEHYRKLETDEEYRKRSERVKNMFTSWDHEKEN